MLSTRQRIVGPVLAAVFETADGVDVHLASRSGRELLRRLAPARPSMARVVKNRDRRRISGCVEPDPGELRPGVERGGDAVTPHESAHQIYRRHKAALQHWATALVPVIVTRRAETATPARRAERVERGRPVPAEAPSSFPFI